MNASTSTASPLAVWERRVRLEEPGTSVLLRYWATWLSLSRVPSPVEHDPFLVRAVAGGGFTDVAGDRMVPGRFGSGLVYVAYGDVGALYAGQTTDTLQTRVRRHLSGSSADSREKRDTWRFVVAARFDALVEGELERLENDAFYYVLPPAVRTARRTPRRH